jgi:two-component system KDP operon response regulator KdpE
VIKANVQGLLRDTPGRVLSLVDKHSALNDNMHWITTPQRLKLRQERPRCSTLHGHIHRKVALSGVAQRSSSNMSDHHHILFVDDEPQITRVMRTALSAQKYDVRVANNGEMALEILKDWTADVVVTDVAMPEMDGIELTRRLRQLSEVPIIVLSVRGQEQAKIQALDAGADDYVTKPFNMNELLARIRAQLRRLTQHAPAESHLIESGDFRIDLDARSVTVCGREVRLTPKEFDLLVYLARHPNKVITHRAMLTAVWGPHSTEQPEYLRVFVGQLRKKLEPDVSSPKYIVTEPWVGYRFEPSPQQSLD